jgi:CHAT domain-containing protein
LRVIANTKAQFKDRMDMDYLAFLGVAGTVEYRTGHYLEAEATLQELLQRAQTNQHNEFLHTTYGYLGLCAAQTQGMAKAHEYFAAMFRQDAELRQQINDTAQQFTYSGDKERLHQDIVRLVAQENDPLRLFNLLQQVKSQALGYQSGIQADFVSIQLALPAKTALLEYYLQGDQHFCLLVSAQYPEPVHILLPDAGSDGLQAIHAQYLKALSVAKYVKTHNPFDLSGASAALLEPLLARLAGHDTLVIAASGYAHQLPFELFPLGQSFLLEQFAITYVPVGGMFQTCQQRRFPAQSSLVIANSHAEDQTNIQEQFLSEATQVAQQLAIEPLLQHPNSASHLLQSVQHRVIHITSHGTFNPAKPTQSGIILKQDGIDVLVAADVWVSSLAGAELVFLSGCDTGKVSLLPNDEIFGPLGLFLTRNVGSLILSHWPVQTQDNTPIAIVTDFYRNWLKEGMSKAKALQQAILHQRNSPNPYFWGEFFLSGAYG